MTRRLSLILSFVILLAALDPTASVTIAGDEKKTYYRVTVLPVDSTAMEERVRTVTNFLLDEPQVKTAKPFTREELERLMKPWLDGASQRQIMLPGSLS